jgi:hypothetical protein
VAAFAHIKGLEAHAMLAKKVSRGVAAFPNGKFIIATERQANQHLENLLL